MRHLIRLTAVLVALAHNAHAEEVLPTGWRIDNEAQGALVEADFNADGIADKAVVITNGDVSKVVAFVSDQRNIMILDLITTLHEPSAIGMKLLPPGQYKTACGKKLVECRGGDPEILDLSRPTLSFSDENVQIVFLFGSDGVKKIWLTD